MWSGVEWSGAGAVHKQMLTDAALAELGVKVVKGDLDDPSSYTPHLEGLYGAYVNADCTSPALVLEMEERLMRGSLGAVLVQRAERPRGGRVRVQAIEPGPGRRGQGGGKAHCVFDAGLDGRAGAAHGVQGQRSVLRPSFSFAYACAAVRDDPLQSAT